MLVVQTASFAGRTIFLYPIIIFLFVPFKYFFNFPNRVFIFLEQEIIAVVLSNCPTMPGKNNKAEKSPAKQHLVELENELSTQIQNDQEGKNIFWLVRSAEFA